MSLVILIFYNLIIINIHCYSVLCAFSYMTDIYKKYFSWKIHDSINSISNNVGQKTIFFYNYEC